MAKIIPAKDVGKVFLDAVNEALADIPDDKTKIAVLNAFSSYMFQKAFDGDDNGGVELIRKGKDE